MTTTSALGVRIFSLSAQHLLASRHASYPSQLSAMPVNINILGPQDDIPSATSLSSSTKKKHTSSKSTTDPTYFDSLTGSSSSHSYYNSSSGSGSDERPRTATSITIRSPSPNLRSSSPAPHSPTIFSLSPRPLSPRQQRCPPCNDKYSSQPLDDERDSRTAYRSRKSFDGSTSTTINATSPVDFDISITNIADGNSSASHHSASMPSSSSVGSPSVHSDAIYYRKLSDLNAECQRLQQQRDNLIAAHQQHIQQLTAQWAAALADIKDKQATVDRSIRRKEDGWGEDRRKLLDKLEENGRVIKQQREDILRLIDAQDANRKQLEAWKREKRDMEDELLIAKREKREAMADVERLRREWEDDKAESTKQVKTWAGVARRAEEELAKVRLEYEAKESERRKREERMREELMRVLNEMQGKEKEWKEREKERDLAERERELERQRQREESERVIATLRINWEQEKSKVVAVERELSGVREEWRAKEDTQRKEREQEREDREREQREERREKDGMRVRLGALEDEKERLEGMVEGLIGKLEDAVREKAERDESDEKERREWHERLAAEERERERLDEDWRRRAAAKEQSAEDEKRRLKERLDIEKHEKREALAAVEDSRRRAADERREKEEVVRGLEEARQVMSEWRQERAEEEERRRKDKQVKRERRERLWQQEREIEAVRRQVRREVNGTSGLTIGVEGGRASREGWEIEITPVERDGWDEKEEAAFGNGSGNRTLLGAGGSDVDVDVRDGRYLSHLTLSPGQSMRFHTGNDGDLVNITV